MKNKIVSSVIGSVALVASCSNGGAVSTTADAKSVPSYETTTTTDTSTDTSVDFSTMKVGTDGTYSTATATATHTFHFCKIVTNCGCCPERPELPHQK